MSELTRLSATRLAQMIRAREVSPVEVAEAFLARVEEVNPRLNAIVTLAPNVLERALEAERSVMRGEALGALHGVPVTVKDTFDVARLRSTSGSRLRANRVPEKDAAAVLRLREAGAIILGKTNVPEMALTYDSDNPLFGRTNNPHDLSRTAGGSSGGEAACIAASLSAAGLGSDLVGSIRIPAHFCGIFGLKPTSSAVSGEGHCPEMIGSLRQAASFGPLARNAEDLRTIFDVLSIKSGDDAIESGPRKSTRKSKPLEGTRACVWLNDAYTPVTEETRRAVERVCHALSDAGVEVIEDEPPGIERGSALWPKRFSPDVLRAVRRVYQTPQDLEQAGRAVRALLSRAANDDAEERAAVEEECATLRRALIEWMMKAPLIIAPVGGVPAFHHGARKVEADGKELQVFDAFGYAQAFNTFDLPVVCVPALRTPEGLPVGVQIAARPFDEEALLSCAALLEKALGPYEAPPVSPSTMKRNPL